VANAQSLDTGLVLDPDEFRDSGYNRDFDGSWYHPSADGTEEYYHGGDDAGVDDETTTALGRLKATLHLE
jgi:hypothetical protein